MSNNLVKTTNDRQQISPSKHQNNGWTTRGEKLVRYWQEECRLYAWIYEQNATYYSRLNRSLGIASIALSAITGTTLFNQSATDPNETSSNILIGLGVSSIASTILSGLKELFDLNSLISQNTNAARENSSIVMDIDEQMNIDRTDRIDGREFLKSIKDRKNALIQNGPIIPSRQWKHVHKKIQSKEQLGFLNREVFNEYLEQSVDINKLQFGLSGTATTTPAANNINKSDQSLEYGTIYNNTISPGPGTVYIDIPGTPQQQPEKLPKTAALHDKLEFYAGPRIPFFIPIDFIDYKKIPIKTIEDELANIQPRSAARKAFIENQYAIEKLLTKTGELKNKEQQQLLLLRDKSREYQDAYQKTINPVLANSANIISNDISRVCNILTAYRNGYITEQELFRIIQLDLMEIDRLTLHEEQYCNTLITQKKNDDENLKDISSKEILTTNFQDDSGIRYPFRNKPSNPPDNILPDFEPQAISLDKKIITINKEITLLEHQVEIYSKELESICELINVSTDISEESRNELLAQTRELERNITITQEAKIELQNELELLTTHSEIMNYNYDRDNLNTYIPDSATILNHKKNKSDRQISIQARNVNSNASISSQIEINGQPNHIDNNDNIRRPSSIGPSDDEFIENLISDNLCSQQLQEIIKPIPQPNSPHTKSISANNHSNTSKSPSRRPSKYDAQMRYQTSRLPYK